MKHSIAYEMTLARVCIKGMGSTFACTCKECVEEMQFKMQEYLKDPDAFWEKKKAEWQERVAAEEAQKPWNRFKSFISKLLK